MWFCSPDHMNHPLCQHLLFFFYPACILPPVFLLFHIFLFHGCGFPQTDIFCNFPVIHPDLSCRKLLDFVIIMCNHDDQTIF